MLEYAENIQNEANFLCAKDGARQKQTNRRLNYQRRCGVGKKFEFIKRERDVRKKRAREREKKPNGCARGGKMTGMKSVAGLTAMVNTFAKVGELIL